MNELVYILSLFNFAVIVGVLAIVQGLLINRLKLPFAGGPVILGLSAYFFAVLPDIEKASLVALIFAAIVFLVVLLQQKLVDDYFLLGTIALAEAMDAVFGSTVAGLGGREGIVLHLFEGVSRVNLELYFVFILVPLLVGTLLIYRYVFSTTLGVYIDFYGAVGGNAKRWLPISKVKAIVLLICLLLWMLDGYIYLIYSGGVAPGIFSLDMAFLVVVFSLIALDRPAYGFIGVFLYYAIPTVVGMVLDVFKQGALFGFAVDIHFDQGVAAELVRIVWGGGVIFIAVTRFGRKVPRMT